jgi:serine/threonine protein kinase
MSEREATPVIQCPNCKEKLGAGTRFCPNCGSPLTETAAVSNALTPSGVRPRTVELQLPTVVGGRYRLDEVRGGGGMAKVYKAWDLNLDREVAVKLINPELRTETEFDARFHREARIASQLTDPHIVNVHDFGIDPNLGPFLVMEFLRGQSLREWLNAEGTMPLKAGLQLASKLFLALIHAHSKDIVHRDIKPDNVFLLNQSGVGIHVKMLDFGIARIMRRDDPSGGGVTQLTSVGAVLGTPRYMSPEQLAGQPLDARTDIYSAALVIFEALTGTLPHQTTKKVVDYCPEAKPALQELLDDCLKPNRDERPATALEAFLRLQAIGKDSGILLMPPGAMETIIAARRGRTGEQPSTVPYEPAPRRRSRRALLVLGGALFVACVGLAAAWFFWPTPKPGPDETLLGVKIGDPQKEVTDRLKLTHSSEGRDPWKSERTKAMLGHVLKPAQLRLTTEEMANLDAYWSDDQKVIALFHGGKLRGLVATQPHHAATGRGLALLSSYSDIFKKYEETFEQEDPVVPKEEDKEGDGHLRILRFDALGLAVQASKVGGRMTVTALALYPTVQTKATNEASPAASLPEKGPGVAAVSP